MISNAILRPLFAIALVAVGLAAAALLGAPLIAAIFPLIAGIAAAYILGRSAAETPAVAAHPVTAIPEPQSPAATDIINALDDPVLIIHERRVVLANDAAKQVLGEHIEGVDVRLAIRHPAATELLAGQAANDGFSPAGRIELAGLGERERRWEMGIEPLPDGSRLVRLSDRSEAFAAEKMREDFVANASHELRTPLATLLGFLETLQDGAGADPETRMKFLGIMFDEARRMQRLVDDLISLSRIEAERFTLRGEAIDLVTLIDEVRQACTQMAETRHSSVVAEIEASDPVVSGDGRQLVQLLQNLVDNALKYGPEGAPVRVRVKDAGPDMLRLSVIDSGEGIPPDHLPHLTQRFYRVDAGRSRSVGGTGLGLAIVKHIVERHRGRLEIKSELGEGTTVNVYLPRRLETAVIKA